MLNLSGLAGNQAGGGDPAEWPDDLTSATLIAAFFDAKSYYTGGAWDAANDSSLKLVDTANPPSLDAGDNQLDFTNPDQIAGNAALLTALSSIDDLTIIAGHAGTGRPDFVAAYSGDKCEVIQYGGSYGYYWSVRDGVAVQSTFGTGASSFKAQRCVFPRNAAGIAQQDDSSESTLSTLADVELGTCTAAQVFSSSGSAQFGFIAFYEGTLDTDDWDTFLTRITDNADYGAAGYTP